MMSRKDANLEGIALLIDSRCRRTASRLDDPLSPSRAMGAGVGEEVFRPRQGGGFPSPQEPPVDAGIVGIVDHRDLG